MSDFPWRKHSSTHLNIEFNKLQQKLVSTTIKYPLSYLRTGMVCSNYFFQKERIKTPSQGKPSCYNFWQQNESKTRRYNDQTQSHDLFTTVVFLNHAPSQFQVMAAGRIYKYFGANKVLDPYAGWGDRCVAAMAMNLDYTGIDCNTNLKKPYVNMIKQYNVDSNSNVQMIFKKSESVNLTKIDFDFVLSSPPYWNRNKTRLLEEYNGTDNNYIDFINESLVPLIVNINNMNPHIWVCLNMPQDMYNDVKKIIGPCEKILKIKSNNNNNKFLHVYCF